jgi:hypothetical protein
MRNLRPEFSALHEPYHVHLQVDPANFHFFVDAINGAAPGITIDNARDINALCEEFKFT